MSEYQYYEFQAIDRPLDASARQALRTLSTRARITATSFTNSYEWGNFKGEPETLMDKWFEAEIERRNAQGYDRAAQMLNDFKILAETRGEAADFARRLMRLREAHSRKAGFLKRLEAH